MIAEDKLLARITVDLRVMVGKPVIKGTRLTVEYIMRRLAQGATPDDLVREYNRLTHEDIQACLPFATEALSSTTFAPLTAEVA